MMESCVPPFPCPKDPPCKACITLRVKFEAQHIGHTFEVDEVNLESDLCSTCGLHGSASIHGFPERPAECSPWPEIEPEPEDYYLYTSTEPCGCELKTVLHRDGDMAVELTLMKCNLHENAEQVLQAFTVLTDSHERLMKARMVEEGNITHARAQIELSRHLIRLSKED